MNEQTEQRRYEVAKAVLAAIKTPISKYDGSPESMRDSARHAIKQADALLDMLGKPEQTDAPSPLTLENIAKMYAHEATEAWKIASYKGDTTGLWYFDGYQRGLRDALAKASGQEPDRSEFDHLIKEGK